MRQRFRGLRNNPEAVLLVAVAALVICGVVPRLNRIEGDATTLPWTQMTGLRLADGNVLVLGGMAAEGPSASAWIYRPQSGDWAQAGQLLRARLSPAVALLRDGRVLVTGGCCPVTAEAEIFEPATGRSTAVANMLTPRTGHSLTSLGDGRVIAIGGSTVLQMLSSAEVFDPEVQTWTPFPSMRKPRTHHATLVLASGDLLVVGGMGFPSDATIGELFRVGATSWEEFAESDGKQNPDPDSVQDAAMSPDGTLLVAEARNRGLGQAAIYAYREGRPVIMRCTTASPKHNEGAVILDGKVILAGGLQGASSSGNKATATVEVFDPDTALWTRLPDLATPRAAPLMVKLSDLSVLVIGGENRDRPVRSMEIIDLRSTQTEQRNVSTSCARIRA